MLLKQCILIVVLVHFAASLICGQTTRPPDEDNQFWFENQYVARFDKRWSASVSGVVRVGENYRRSVDERAVAILNYRISKNWSVFGGYLYRRGRPVGVAQTYENRTFGGASFALPISKYTLTTRQTLEYRGFSALPNTVNYRLRQQVERPATVFKNKLRLFAAAEVFYDGRRNDWFRTRFTTGAGKQLNEKLALDVYYLRQNDGVFRPGNLNVLGTTLRVTLR